MRLSLTLYDAGETEASLLFAALALDGTAAKAGGRNLPNRERFTTLIRDNYDIFGPFAMPGIALDSRFPVRWDGKDETWDVADLVYKIHRCTHGHGDELPAGFELIPDSAGPLQLTHLEWDGERGRVRLSDRLIFGLLATSVAHPINVDVAAGSIGYLTFDGGVRLEIGQSWGSRSLFEAVIGTVELPVVTLDLTDGSKGNAEEAASNG